MEAASNEREVYETPDSPVIDDRSAAPPEYESEFISHDALSPQTARANFDKSLADTTATDFTAAKPVGWSVGPRLESRPEKVARLRREIEELSCDGEPEHIVSQLILDLDEAVSNNRDRNVTSPNAGKVTTQISLEAIEKISLLEARLSVLEQRLGPVTSNNLAAQVERIQAKIDIITSSPEELDKIVKKLQPLAEQATQLEESPTAIQINELFAALQTINEISPTLTLVIERLRSLQVIHKDAAEVHNTLDEIQTRLDRRQHEIEEWKVMLKHIEDEVSTSSATMSSNIAILRQISMPGNG